MVLFNISKLMKVLPMSHILSRNYVTKNNSKVFSTIMTNKDTGNVIKQMNEIIDDCLNQTTPCKEFPELGTYLKRAINYTTKYGEMLKYALTVNAYDMAEVPGQTNIETRKLAEITGICWEMLFCTFLMSDDLEDGNKIRFHQPCWYTLPDVGVKVITDIVMIRGLQHEIINKSFDQHPHRWIIGDIVNQMYFYGAIAQYLDRVTSQVKNMDYSNFTIKQWESQISYRSGYAFYGPVFSGLALTKRTDIEEISKLVRDICFRFGHIYQMQNDFHDNYGDFDVLRKDGTDTQEGKCTWLAVTALQRATPAQRSVFARNYGRADADHVTKIKELYDDLQLQEVFAESLNNTFDEIKEMIHRLPDNQLQIMMKDIVNCMCKDVFAHYGDHQRVTGS